MESIGIFNSFSAINTTNKLVETPFYKSVVKHIDINSFNQIVNNFIPLLSRNYERLISDILDELPREWELTLNLSNRIDNYLSNQRHIDTIKNIVLQSKK